MTKQMRNTIARTPKVGRYMVADNAVFEDQALSWEARGLMGYLLSKPDHWQVRLNDLIRRGPAGEHKVRRIQQELRAAGYLRRRRFRRADGTFDWVTTIHERPEPPEVHDPTGAAGLRDDQ